MRPNLPRPRHPARAGTRPLRASVALACLAVALVAARPALTDVRPGDPPDVRDPLLLAIATSPSGRTAMAAGEHGTLLRREGGEGAWIAIESPTDVLLTSLVFADEENVWAAGHDATLLGSTDAGRTWSLLESDPEAEAPFLTLWFESAGHGFAFGAYGLALETLDGGQSWDERSLDEEGPHLYGVASTASDSLFVVGEFGTILRSGDGGETWNALDSPYSGTFFGSLALSDGALLVYGLRGNVYRSEDDGTSWTQVEIDAAVSLLSAIELEDGTVLLAGLAGSVLLSRDGGRTFEARNRDDRLALTGLVSLGGEVWASSERGVIDLSSARRDTGGDAPGNAPGSAPGSAPGGAPGGAR